MSSKIDSDSVQDFGDIISHDLATLLKDNNDFLLACSPVGTIAPILFGFPGVPLPDSNVWQECNGSEITNPNSPLRSQNVKNFTPNMIDRYMKVPSIFGQSGQTGGVNATLQFKHNHGGRTNTVGVGGAVKSGFNTRTARPHSHAINDSFANPVNVEPPFYTVKFYIRIQ